jgi:hypothetical protein
MRDLSDSAWSFNVISCFSTAGGIFRKVPRDNLPYLDVTWSRGSEAWVGLKKYGHRYFFSPSVPPHEVGYHHDNSGIKS